MDSKNKKTNKKAKTSKNAKLGVWDNFLADIALKIRKKWDEEERVKLEGMPLPEGVEEITDIAYAGDKLKAHTLDIYFPAKKKGSLPVLIDVHGGAFVSGSKFSDRLFGYAMASIGFLVFNVEYRLAPKKADVFKQIEDVYRATQWIVKNAKTYGGDLNNIYFSGHSAGAVLAVAEILLNLDEDMRMAYGFEKIYFDIKGAILNCGYMRFYQNLLPYQMVKRVVFPPKPEKDARYNYLRFDKNEKLSLLPKIFLVTNSKDDIRAMTLYFDKLLRNAGVPHKLTKESVGGHVGLLYDPLCEKNSRVLTEIMEFFEIKNS